MQTPPPHAPFLAPSPFSPPPSSASTKLKQAPTTTTTTKSVKPKRRWKNKLYILAALPLLIPLLYQLYTGHQKEQKRKLNAQYKGTHTIHIQHIPKLQIKRLAQCGDVTLDIEILGENPPYIITTTAGQHKIEKKQATKSIQFTQEEIKITNFTDAKGIQGKVKGEIYHKAIPCPQAQMIVPKIDTVCVNEKFTPQIKVQHAQSDSVIAYTVNDRHYTTENTNRLLEHTIGDDETVFQLKYIQSGKYRTELTQKFKIYTHPVPTASLHCDRGVIEVKVDHAGKVVNPPSLPVKYTGSPPFVMQTTSGEFTNADEVPYNTTLLAVNDQHCSGTIVNRFCSTKIIERPTLHMLSTRLENQCASDIGLDLTLSMTGKPPFKVDYRESHGSGSEEKTYNMKSHRANFQLTPTVAGQWTYDFHSITDANYKQIAITPIVLSTNVVPNARIVSVKQSSKEVCPNEKATVKVEISGQEPYTIHLSDGRQIHGATSPLQFEATQSVELTGLEDGRKCLTSVQHRVEVHTRPVAYAMFPSKPFSVREGERIRIPIDHRGSVEIDGKPFDGMLGSGTHRITKVSDGNCPGKIMQPDTMHIGTMTKPVLQLGTLRESCVGDDLRLDISMEGSPPYVVHTDSEVIKFSAPHKLSLDTSKPGTFTRSIAAISDAIYTHRIPVKDTVKYVITARPSVRMDSTPIQRCEGDSEPIDLPITVSGKAPFHLEYTLNQEVYNVTFDKPNWTIRLPKLSLGQTIMSVTDFRDSSICEAQLDLTPVKITINEKATITPLSTSRDTCVDTRVNFALGVHPPWTVTYKVNDTVTQQTLSRAQFSLMLQEPGTLEILKVCQSSGCCSEPNLIHRIHPKPGAVMSDGVDYTENIREGKRES